MFCYLQVFGKILEDFGVSNGLVMHRRNRWCVAYLISRNVDRPENYFRIYSSRRETSVMFKKLNYCSVL
jgi:hypothetical protein